jgi:hypothetical protein
MSKCSHFVFRCLCLFVLPINRETKFHIWYSWKYIIWYSWKYIEIKLGFCVHFMQLCYRLIHSIELQIKLSYLHMFTNTVFCRLQRNCFHRKVI